MLPYLPGALLALTLSVAGAPVPAGVWSASTTSAQTGNRLVHDRPDDWRIVRIGGRSFAALKQTDDCYSAPSLAVQLDKPAASHSWLTLDYLDRGYGLITVAGASGVAQDESGNTRLNTGKVRRAVFRLQPGARSLRIGGVGFLGQLTVTETQPPREAIPPHEPAFRLKSPPLLIMGNLAGTGMPEARPGSIGHLRNVLPLLRAIGFNGVESYVQWNLVERSPGVFDWSAYDPIVDECERNGLGWFPLIVVGSAYALPSWFHDSPDFVGFRCLEHGVTIDIPTIFHPGQERYVRRFLAEFGKHYGARKVLLGFRLGPSGNFGEAQYPASGNFGYNGLPMHTHIGYWAGDPYAKAAFRRYLRGRYATVNALNQAWGGAEYGSFDDVQTFLPDSARNARMRADFGAWYMGAMSEWCEKWAKWAREAVPNKPIYQSSGGWGSPEIGTDYVAHTKSMAKFGAGIRLTNENDSFLNDFCVTRPAASAARYYGAAFGTEPAGFNSRRGVMGRLFNIVTNNGQLLFFYQFNILGTNGTIDAWIRHAPLLDQRAEPANEIAAFYPDTANRLDDGIMRHLYASQLFAEAKAFRSVTDYDFASEQMILDGALDRHKVLVFLAGHVTEQPVLERVDAWIRAGGVAIYPLREGSSEEPLRTIEGDAAIWLRWRRGDTGRGRVIFYDLHPEPGLYTRYLRRTLPTLKVLRPGTRAAIRIQKPDDTYWSMLTTGKLALINYGDDPATVRLADGTQLRLAPYAIRLYQAGSASAR